MKAIKFRMLALTLFAVLAFQVQARAQNPFDKIALGILVDKYGIDIHIATGFQSRYHQSVYEAAPLYSTCYYTHRPVDDVWKLRQQGLGWGQIAHRLGMNP